MGMGATFRVPVIIQKVLTKHLTLLALQAIKPYFMRVSRLLASRSSTHYKLTLIRLAVVP